MNLHVLARNIFANWFGFAVNVCIMFLLTPFVLSALGDTRYGIWVLVTSVTGYCGLLDFGIRSGTTQYLTKSLSQKNYDNVNSVINSSIAPLAVVGVLIAALCPITGLLLPHVFQIPKGMDRELFWCLTFFGVSVAIEVALNPFHAVFVAKQRFDLSNVLGVTSRLLSACAVWLCLSAGYGLVGLAIVMGIANSLESIIRGFVAWRLLPQLTVSFRSANWQQFRSIVNFGIWSFLLSINLAIALYTDAFVIGVFLPVATITFYALAANLARYLGRDLLGSARQVFYPATVDLHARQLTSELRVLYLSGSRILLVIAICVAVVSIVWVEDFFHLWVGDQLGPAQVGTTALLFRILCAAIVVEFSSTLAGQLLIASGRIKAIAVLGISQAVLNVVLTVLLLPILGLPGAAIGTLGSVLLLRTILPVWLAQKEVGIGIRDYYMSVLPRPFAIALLCGTLAIALREWDTPEDWSHLVWHGLLAAGVLGTACLCIGLTSAERTLLYHKLLNRHSVPPVEPLEATAPRPAETKYHSTGP